ncbi:Matrin-type domain-containing protein [Aphelenchoides besseyi]|nr:Matrin-type domain-containing protein [Aphelenchoides besseyi]
MDFQNRVVGKTGGGGVASALDANVDRRERLQQLALETIDLQKDPYFMRNHLSGYECKLCLTLHNNEGSYLAHTQGKEHQANLARRTAKKKWPISHMFNCHKQRRSDLHTEAVVSSIAETLLKAGLTFVELCSDLLPWANLDPTAKHHIICG